MDRDLPPLMPRLGINYGPYYVRDCSLYILETPSGHRKIGIAKNVPQRARELQTGNHEPIKIAGICEKVAAGYEEYVAPAYDVERLIHRLLAPFRTQGEWFKVDEETVLIATKLAFFMICKPAVVARYSRYRAWAGS